MFTSSFQFPPFASISCSSLCKCVISCSLSHSLTAFTSYSDSTLWFLWGRQTSPEASFYNSVYFSKWIREAGELFKLTSYAAVLKSIVTFATYWSLSATRLFIPSSQLTGCPKSSVQPSSSRICSVVAFSTEHNVQPVLSSLSQPPLADDGHTHVVKGCVTVLIKLGLIEKTRHPAELLCFSEGKETFK